MTKKYKIIGEYLDQILPNPKCELNYNSDYTLLMSIVLSAQTTDKRVNEVTRVLFYKYPTIKSLVTAPIDDIKQILHPIGNFNKKAQYIKEIAYDLYTKYNSCVPLLEDELLNLKGVGRKTVNVFLSEYRHIPRIAVDTHVLRIAKRLNLTKNINPLSVEEVLMKNFPKETWGKRHLQLVLFGRYYCKAKKPECLNCPLKIFCQYEKRMMYKYSTILLHIFI